MAFISAEIKLPEVGRTLTTRLYFPTDLPSEVGNKVKGVITLLHGYSNTPNDWLMMTAACRYAADNGFILVAPDAENSFYTNMAFGPPWYTMLTQLLPAQLNRIFNLPTSRECNFIAGLSMGGYGALRIGLSAPERYAAIGSFSGVVDVAAVAQVARAVPDIAPMLTPVLGPELHIPDDADIFKLAEKVSTLPESQRPRLFVTCGAQDNDSRRILDQNHNLQKHLETLPLDYRFAQWDGVHEWNFWDRSLAEFIGFACNNDYGSKKQGDWASPATLFGRDPQ